MKRKILQSIADNFIKVLEKSPNDEIFMKNYELALWFDAFCIDSLGVYLD